VAASTIAVCGGQPATAAVSNPISGTTYQWFDAASGGNILYTGPAYTLSSVTSNITLYVQAVSASGCSSSARSSVAITADSTPAAPGVAATNVAICPGGMAIFSIATPVSGVTYNWYSTPTGGTPLATGTTYTTPALSVSATYYVEAGFQDYRQCECDQCSGCSDRVPFSSNHLCGWDGFPVCFQSPGRIGL
jgi:hypothetical protein